MCKRVDEIIVLGGGSAGFLSALTLKRLAPQVRVRLIRSRKIPVIGVGESTTAAFPAYVHGALGLDRKRFYSEVRPSWKLGIRFIWGPPGNSYFYYPFDSRMDFRRPDLPRPDAYFCVRDQRDSTPYSVLMDRGASACYLRQGRYNVDEGFGYHVDTIVMIDYLERMAGEYGVEVWDGDLGETVREDSGNLEALVLADGRRVEADLFIDCTGFRSLLLGKDQQVPFVSYERSLACDCAVVGYFPREGPILPYTTAETMDHGWCWRIEFEDRVSRGYVFSSRFCSTEDAMAEMKRKNPELGDDLRLIRFPTGRHEEFWVNNVVAIGNSSAFVEPLESTALHMVTEQLRFLCQGLLDSNRRIIPAVRRLQNMRYRHMWDDIRGFLAMHYKFNRRSETPFWTYCREETDLAGAADKVEYYREAGPSTWMSKLLSDSMFGYTGYVTLLMGQQVPTSFDPELTDEHWRTWDAHRDRMRQEASVALPMRDALQLLNRPDWTWPVQGN